jgi:hypothetical protein
MLHFDLLCVVLLVLARSVFGGKYSGGNFADWTPPLPVASYPLPADTCGVAFRGSITITQGHIHVPKITLVNNTAVKAPLVVFYNGFGVCADQLPAVTQWLQARPHLFQQ